MSDRAGFLSCNVCDAPPARPDVCETAKVRSNIRRFRSEEFVVWRRAEEFVHALHMPYHRHVMFVFRTSPANSDSNPDEIRTNGRV